MSVVLQLTLENHHEPDRKNAKRVYPVDCYEVPREVLAIAGEHRLLKVPLLGQYYELHEGDQQDWCGRTSSSMLYNYFQAVEGGDPKGRYITHWNADKHPFLDLRFPDGSRAFHQNPNGPPFDRKVSGYSVRGELPTRFPQYKTGRIFPYEGTPARLAQAAAIRQSEAKLREQFGTILTSIQKNNPVVIYTGFSKNTGSPKHLILITGYFYLKEGSEEHLWIAIADPSTESSKCVGSSSKGPHFFKPVSNSPDGNDVANLKNLSSEHNLLRLYNGDWPGRVAALSLVRARFFFEESVGSPFPYDLYLDDMGNTDAKGGMHLYMDVETAAPPELIVTDQSAPIALPFDAPDAPRSPVSYFYNNETQSGGFYPLGAFRNIHSGVHLKPEATGLAPVRACAPGHIVAIRMIGGVPGEIATPEEADHPSEADAEELAGNSRSLILVRHALDLMPPPDQEGEREPEQRLSFYSLYMHLAAPRWSGVESAYSEVPWLNALLRRRGGSLTIVDPDRADLGAQRFPVAAPEGELVETGSLEVVGERFSDRTRLELGAAGRVRAVAKAPEADLSETFQALADGKVVTFEKPHPDLVVDRGELIGFVKSTSAMGQGFLHFEVLSPSGGSSAIKKILEFAEARLSLGSGFFKNFKEKSSNNFFDDGGGEIAALKALLPDGGADLHLDEEYSPLEVRRAMNRGDQIGFSEPRTTIGDGSELAYTAKLKLDQLRDAMPAGSYTLRFRFTGRGKEHTEEVQVSVPERGAAEAEVKIPGWAERAEVEGQGFHLMPGTGRPTPEERAEHLAHLGGARFRNVWMTHLNEWSLDGLKTALDARFEEGEDDWKAYAEATAWWAHNEEPVMGPEGAEAPLFKDGGNARQLPTSGELDHMHPVVAFWLMGSLVEEGHARFVEDWAGLAEEEEREIHALYAGWLPAEAERAALVVGDPVRAIAVSDAPGGFPGGGEAALLARVEGWSDPVELARGPWQGDVLLARGEPSLWGSLTLEVEGESPDPLGGETLVIRAPVPEERESAPAPTRQTARGKPPFAWSVSFTDACPKRLQGWVTMKAHKGAASEAPPAASDFAEGSVGLPIVAEREQAAASAGLRVENGWIVQGPPRSSTHISANFTWKEYCDAHGGKAPARVAQALIEGVQALRTALGSSVHLGRLADDGLSIEAYGSSRATLIRKANDTGRFAEVDDSVAAPWVKLRVEAPPEVAEASPGTLHFAFDPTEAYRLLLEELDPSPTEVVHVIFGYRFFNGGHLLAEQILDIDQLGTGAIGGIDWAELERAANDERFGAFASEVSAVLSRPAFGEPVWRISGSSLVVSVPLIGGDQKMWKAAAPMIDVDGNKSGTIAKLAGAAEHEPQYAVTRSLLLSDRRYKAKEMTIKAVVTKTGVVFNGAEVQIADSDELSYDSTPGIDAIDVTALPEGAPERLEIRAQTYGIPATSSLEVYFQGGDKSEAEWARVSVHYERPDRWASGRVTGLTDEHGVFLASVPLSQLYGVLQPADSAVSYTLLVGRRWGQVLNHDIEALQWDGSLDPAPADDEDAPEEGPITGGMNVEEDR